jgi:hypothetical protein
MHYTKATFKGDDDPNDSVQYRILKFMLIELLNDERKRLQIG